MSPIREFICPNGHLTEKVLFGEADQNTYLIACEHPGFAGTCAFPADRLDIPTRIFDPSEDFFIAKAHEKRKAGAEAVREVD